MVTLRYTCQNTKELIVKRKINVPEGTNKVSGSKRKKETIPIGPVPSNRIQNFIDKEKASKREKKSAKKKYSKVVVTRKED